MVEEVIQGVSSKRSFKTRITWSYPHYEGSQYRGDSNIKTENNT